MSLGLASWLCVVSAYAQADGAIAGVVRDETGGVLPGVSVDLQSGAKRLATLTDRAGTYRFEHVAPGLAILTFRLINFTAVRRGVTVAADQQASVDVVLTLSMAADVVVTAASTFRNLADLENPAENVTGVASAASQGAITARQLVSRPVMRPAEVLEAVPGLIATQHSGEGKANQYFLRGFNLDHGSDFATTIAGVPVNMPAGGHAHGYSDSNALLTEIISGVQFKKGPYYAEDGDFSAAGSANVNYVDRLARPIASLSAGGQGWRRLFAAASPRVGSGHLLGGVELIRNDGPWEMPDGLRKANGLLRYSRGDTRHGISITALAYSATWNATDQVPRRAIDSGLISRYGSMDPSDGGTTSRYTLVVDGQRASTNASTRITAFVQRYTLDLFSNFTYFLGDSITGDQFEQVDRRWVTGGRASHRRLHNVFGRHTESAVGLQIRHDAIGQLGLFQTAGRRRLPSHTHASGPGHATRDDAVDQSSAGMFGQVDIEWTSVFRTTIGVRGDAYRFDVRSSNALNSGRGVDALVSPKFTAVLGPSQGTEVYVNAGYGFHSTDARGATITVDPGSGGPAERLDLLTPARGAELGIRTVRLKGVQSTVAVWYLGFDSELVFVGDAGGTDANRPSRRFGIEWTNYLRLTPWMTAEADLSFSRARFADRSRSGNRIPGALDRVIAGALTVEPITRVFGSIRMRHFGPRPLVEDGTVNSSSNITWNGAVGVALSRRFRLTVNGFNLLDATAADIEYFYTSRLRGEPADGVNDFHSHPTVPRMARVTLQVTF